MAINFTDFSGKPLLDSPAKSIFEDVLKGYKMQQEPGKMKREATAKELANQLKDLEVKHKPKEYALNDRQAELVNSLKEKANSHYEEKYGQEKRLREANIKKAESPASPKGALASALQLRNNLDRNSPTYDQDKTTIENYINKISTPKAGINVTTNPEGGVEVSIGGNGEVANTMGLPALPKGQTYLFDENRKPIGIGKPYTEGEKKEAGGRAAFNIYQKFITDAQAPYSGQDSSSQFLNDVSTYSTDPEAKSRIDNLIAADNLLFSTTVKEEATLGGANTNQAYNRITHSLNNSEVYPLLKNIAKYELPQGYKKASSDIFNKVLNEGTDAGAKIPAYKPYYFNQERPSTAGAGTGKVPVMPATIKTKEQFQAWLKTLTPAQRAAHKAQHVGGK
jgi:hypothetical protein